MWSKISCAMALVALLGNPGYQEPEPQGRGGVLWERPLKPLRASKPSLPPSKVTRPLPQISTEPAPGPRRSESGLGYTLYRRDEDGRAVRADPSRVFHSGDAVRFVFEPNLDGYLYIFNSENDLDPRMIFPNWRLHGGTNAVRAFVPYEVPSSRDENPKRRWFTFHGTPAVERFYIVISHQPLAGIPTGEALLQYCRQNPDACPWRPTISTWTQVKGELQVAVSVTKSRTFGDEQSSVEREAISRELDLEEDAPPPSVVCKNTVSNRNILVTVIDLVHK